MAGPLPFERETEQDEQAYVAERDAEQAAAQVAAQASALNAAALAYAAAYRAAVLAQSGFGHEVSLTSGQARDALLEAERVLQEAALRFVRRPRGGRHA